MVNTSPAGKKTGRRSGLPWLGRFALIAISAWIVTLAILAAVYTQGLTHPACPISADSHRGYQPVTLRTRDGFNLRGWYRTPQNGAVILLLGGNGSGRDDMLLEADILAAAGYGSLTIEYRSCQGGPATLGYKEAWDVETMAKYAAEQPGVTWIGALGFSAGSVAVLRASPDLPQIKAVVVEGQYRDLEFEILNDPDPVGSFRWQLDRIIMVSTWATVGIWPTELSPINDLPRLSPRPVLLIFGEKEMINNQGQAQFDAAKQPKQLWVIPGADHGQYAQTAGTEYARRIVAFFDNVRGK